MTKEDAVRFERALKEVVDALHAAVRSAPPEREALLAAWLERAERERRQAERFSLLWYAGVHREGESYPYDPPRTP